VIERLLVAQRALADGQLDQAERMFRQVAEADERNAIAVVGLAEVAMAREDRELARSLAEQALAIDPDDAAAIRVRDAALAAPAPLPGAPGEAAAAGLPEARRSPSLATRLGAWLRRILGRPD
jgi:tetratricopeptide (TPR) repeat protein